MLKGIRGRLLIVMVLLVIVPFILMNVTNYYLVTRGYEKTVETNHRTLAKSLSQNISTYMTNYYLLTEEIANNEDIKSFDHERQANVLVGSAGRNAEIDLFYAVDINGMQTARSSGNLGDRSERWWFKKMIAEKQPFVSESYFSLTGNIPVTSVFIPMFEGSQFVGLMGTDLKLDVLQDLVEGLKTDDGTIAYIIDNKGVVIAHPDKEQVSEQYNYISMKKNTIKTDASGKVVLDAAGNHETVEENINIPEELKIATLDCLDGKMGFVQYENTDKKGVVSAYAPIVLPGESEFWGVITVQSKSTALGFVNNVIKGNAIFALVLMIATVFISILISRNISAPLTKLKDAFEGASQGNLGVCADIKGKDEFADVGRCFDDMLKNINGLVKDVDIASKTLGGSASDLSRAMNQATIANNEVGAVIEDIADGAVKLTEDAGFGADKINELADMIERVSNSSNQINIATKKANDLNQKGIVVMDILKSKSKDNEAATQRLGNMINEVDKSSIEIGDITNTISQISEQTNLLALNAAIEAARVGEAGRGFTVVADEIRKLAEESSVSAEHIRTLIERIQDQSNAAVNAVKESELIAEEQNMQVGTTEEIFGQIASSIRELNEEMSQVTQLIGEMADNKEGIVKLIESISSSSLETSASTEEVSASIQEQLEAMKEINNHVIELEDLSRTILESISKFS